MSQELISKWVESASLNSYFNADLNRIVSQMNVRLSQLKSQANFTIIQMLLNLQLEFTA